jgi:hypothetical protein
VTRRKAPHSLGSRWQVRRLKKDLEELYVRCDPRSLANTEIGGDLSRYLCVRVSGFLEQAVAVILREYCSRGSWGGAQRFAHSWLDKSPNLSADALVKLVSRFDSSWASELQEFLNIDERASSLNALMGIRNDIAHGKNQGVSRERVWEYYELADRVVEWMLDKFEPKSALNIGE